MKISKYDVCLLDLVTDSNTGKLSTTKLWMHVANVIMSKIMLTQPLVDWELLTAYGAIVGGSYIASMLVKYRYGGQNVASDVAEK